jgi:predicted nucleotidyltransferase
MAAIDLEGIAQKHGIRLLLQFGSTVGGQVHARSDVDLGVLLERLTPTFRQHAEVLHDLQTLFPDREVDLAVLNHADPLFLKKVTDNCRLLHGSPADLRQLQLSAFKRYHDYRRYLDLERRFVAQAVAGLAGRG